MSCDIRLKLQKMQVQNLLMGMQEVRTVINANTISPNSFFTMPKSRITLQQIIGSSPISACFNSLYFHFYFVLMVKNTLIFSVIYTSAIVPFNYDLKKIYNKNNCLLNYKLNNDLLINNLLIICILANYVACLFFISYGTILHL